MTDERGPTLEQIQDERNPSLRGLIAEGQAIAKEMCDVQKAEIKVFLRTQPMELKRLQAVLEMRKLTQAKQGTTTKY